MYIEDEVSVHQTCFERATQPYSLGGGGTIYPGSRPAGVTTRSPRMVTECLLTRSVLIKMYYHFMVCACICTILFTVSQFHTDVYMYLVYLVFQLHNVEGKSKCEKTHTVSNLNKNRRQYRTSSCSVLGIRATYAPHNGHTTIAFHE